MSGWVYVITNPAIPDRVKVGYTEKPFPEQRARELKTTGVPFDYEVVFAARVEIPQALESAVHRALAKWRADKEWFSCTVVEAIATIEGCSGGSIAEVRGTFATKLSHEDFERIPAIRSAVKTRRDAELRKKHELDIEAAKYQKAAEVRAWRQQELDQFLKSISGSEAEDARARAASLGLRGHAAAIGAAVFSSTIGLLLLGPWGAVGITLTARHGGQYKELIWLAVFGVFYLFIARHFLNEKREKARLVYRAQEAEQFMNDLKTQCDVFEFTVQTEELSSTVRIEC